jgi:menaquinone-dependent protoporphyrinogen IX oxidase
MKQLIRKRDLITLLDGREAKVLELITQMPTKVFKVEITADKHVEDWDESKLKLKKQHLINKWKDMIR